MMRTLASEGFRLERLPLRVTVRRGCCCALLRVSRCGCRPNGMELPLSLARGRSRRRRHHPHAHRETTRGWQGVGKCFASVRKCLASKSACLDLRKYCLDLRRSCQSLAKVLRRWVLGWGRPCVFGNRYVPSTQIFSDFLIRFSQISARSVPN